MLDIITAIMRYYFQSGFRSDCSHTQAAWRSCLLRPLESVLRPPVGLRMGTCKIKKNGWATVKDNLCSKQ